MQYWMQYILQHVPYDMYIPIVAMDVTAVKATIDPSIGLARTMEKSTIDHVAMSGVIEWGESVAKKPGTILCEQV